MTRIVRAAIVAALCVLGFALVVQNTVKPSICESLTPDNWFLWWWYGCDKDSSGGGGSGAGMD